MNLMKFKSQDQAAKEDKIRLEQLKTTEIGKALLKNGNILNIIESGLLVKKDHPEKINYFLSFTIDKANFELIEDLTEVLLFQTNSIFISFTIRNESKGFEILMSKFLILNKYSRSDLFPKLLEIEYLAIKYDTINAIYLKIKSGDLSLFVDFYIIMHLSQILRNILNENSDFAKYVEDVSDTTERYIAKGQTYIIEAIETGVAAKYELEIEIKAPLIVIPLDVLQEKSPVLLIDFGKLIGRSSSNKIGNLDYNTYRFEIFDIKMFTKNLSSQYNSILFPVSVNLDLFTCKTLQYISPGLSIRVLIGKTEFFVSDKMISLCVSLIKKFKQLLTPSDNWRPKKPKKEPVHYSTLAVPTLYQLELEESNFKLIQNSRLVSELVLKTIKFKINTHSNHNLKSKLIIGKVTLQYLTHDFNWQEVLTTAFYTQDENHFEDAKQDTYHVHIGYNFKPLENVADASFKISDLRLIAYVPFYVHMKVFFRDCVEKYSDKIKNPSEKTPESQNPPVSDRKFRFSARFQDFEICAPVATDSCWEYAKLKVDMTLVSIIEYNKPQNLKNKFIKPYYKTQYESNIMLNHIQFEVVNGKHRKQLIQPTRVSVNYIKIDIADDVPKTEIEIRMESLSLNFGFRDLDFLKKLQKYFLDSLVLEPSNKPQAEFVSNTAIEFDSLQITLQEDTISHPYCIAFFQFSNFLLSMTRLSEESKNYFTTVFFMDFYNLSLGEWEPLIEDWKFTIETSKKSKDLPEIIQLKSMSVLNINITNYMADTVGIIMKRSQQSLSDWESADYIDIPQTKKLDYEITNDLSTDIIIWFLDPTTDGKLIKSGQKIELQYQSIKKIYSKVPPKNKFEVGKLIPHSISIQIHGFHDTSGIFIDNSNHQIFYMSDGSNAITCRKDVFINYNKRSITLVRDCCVVNNSGLDIKLKYQATEYCVNAKFYLPLLWKIDDLTVVAAQREVSVSSESYIEVEDGKYVVIDKVVSGSTQESCSTIIVVSSPWIFTNLLPCPVNIVIDGQKVFLPSGHKYYFLSNPSSISLELLLTAQTLLTANIPETSNKILILDQPHWKILYKKTNPTPKTIDMSIYCQILVVNCTEFTISLQKLIVQGQSLGFFCTNKETLRLKILGEFQSEWSENFNSKAIGLSSCIVIPMVNSVFKNFSFGIKILQAPSPLIHTRIIKILPRFAIYNHLEFLIYVKQYHKTLTRVIEIPPNKLVYYQFDDYYASNDIQVSEDETNWSGPFSVNNIDDFQIRFRGSPRELPKLKNIFAKNPFWYLSCPRNNMYYYARINITSQYDTSVLVSISNPRVPCFKIYNATEEPIKVRQSKCKLNFIQIPPGVSLPWAFDNHLLTKKKVAVLAGDFKQKYSLEKIKENNKNIGKYSATVSFEGETRVLTIYNIEEIVHPLKIELLRGFTQTTITCYKLFLNEINFSLIDDENSEKFLVSLKEVYIKNKQAEHKRNKNSKIRTKKHYIIGNFQIDNMNPNRKLYPVILYQSEIIENTPFFELKYDREYTSGDLASSFIVPFDRFLEFELQMQGITVKLNYEFIISWFKLKKMYMDRLYQKNDLKKLEKSMKLEELYPDLDCFIKFPGTGVESIKTYFKYVRIHGLKLSLTFKNLEDDRLERNFFSALLDLVSIDNSPLKFTEIILRYSFQNFYTLGWAVTKNYTRQGLLQFYRLLGSSELLGNPIGLIDKLGTGVYEFINEPAKGLLQGPKGFVNGVGKGIRSLVGNVISASFQSVSKITGSLYKIISYEKPPSGSLYRDFGFQDLTGGLTGILIKPYRGFKLHGTVGLVEGVGLGLLGAIVSPVAAVLHFSSTLSLQVAKTGEFINITRKHIGRIRDPRFINSRRVLEPYDSNLAKIKNLILIKGLDEHEVKVFAELGKEFIAVTQNFIIAIANQEIVREFQINSFNYKEIHFYHKSFVLSLHGEKTVYLSSKFYAPLLKIFLAI